MLDDDEEVLELEELEVDGVDDGVEDPDVVLGVLDESDEFVALEDEPESDELDEDELAGRSELLLVERESLR